MASVILIFDNGCSGEAGLVGHEPCKLRGGPQLRHDGRNRSSPTHLDSASLNVAEKPVVFGPGRSTML